MIAFEDHAAGLRFMVPADWDLKTDDLLQPLTAAVSAPLRQDNTDDWVREQKAIAQEQKLWEMAANPDFNGDELDELLDDQTEQAVVFAGRWEHLFEAAPGVEELLDGAVWLARSYGEFFEFFPDSPVEAVDHSRRKITVGGRPAATVSYRIVAEQGGRNSGYLRAVVVHLAEGRVSFAFGLAKPDEDRLIIDTILDSVTPLA